MNFDLSQLPKEGYITLVSILTNIASGYLFIFMFYRQLFLSLSPFKLTVLMLGITLPLFGLNMFIGYEIYKTANYSNIPYNATFGSLYATMLGVFPMCLACLFRLYLKITPRIGVLLIGIGEILWLITGKLGFFS